MLPVLADTVQFCHGCLPGAGQDFHGCHLWVLVQFCHGSLYGYCSTTVMAAYMGTDTVMSWLPVCVLEQYRHGCNMGTDTAISWLPVRDR